MCLLIKDFSFEDLKDNFHHRSNNFELYRSRLSQSNPRLLHWVGSINYSGYVRQKSLKYLIDNYQPGDENRILLRLSDWVEEIRALAFEWTKNNIDKLSIEQISDNAGLIIFLSGKYNSDVRLAVKLIQECLFDRLKNITPTEFQNLDRNLREYVYAQASPENKSIRQILIEDKDPINRLYFLERYSYSELTPTEIKLLQQDKCALIKKKFIYYRLKYNVRLEQSELTKLALDKNKSVRELAGYYLTKYHGVDLYKLYKQKSDLQFYYIADFARQEDLKHFLEGMQSSNKQIRLICFRALCDIKPELVKQFDLKQLILENNKFRQLITKRVLPVLPLAELQQFRSALFLHPQGKAIYLSLLYKKSYWDFVQEALDLIIAYPTTEAINLILGMFQKNNYVYRAISNAKKQTIVAKINRVEELESDRILDLCQKLKFYLKNA